MFSVLATIYAVLWLGPWEGTNDKLRMEPTGIVWALVAIGHLIKDIWKYAIGWPRLWLNEEGIGTTEPWRAFHWEDIRELSCDGVFRILYLKGEKTISVPLRRLKEGQEEKLLAEIQSHLLQSGQQVKVSSGLHEDFPELVGERSPKN